MKTRELILWTLVIIALAISIHNLYWIRQNYNLIKIMGETQTYILELLDFKLGFWAI